MTSHLSQSLLIHLVLLAGLNVARAAESAAWEVTKTVALDGLEVTLTKPVLVARSSAYLWFPTMTRLSGGELFAVFSTNLDAVVADRTAAVSWSSNDGLTWSPLSAVDPKADLFSECTVRLQNGDELLLPFNMYPDSSGMHGLCQVVSGEKGLRKIRVLEQGLHVGGWPRPDRSFNAKLGLSGFGFNGQTLQSKERTYLATMYGYFKDATRYSLVLVESKDGFTWTYRSQIAGADCPLEGSEGPCESAITRLKNGRLMCVFRLASNVPLGQSFSDDEGKTWSEPRSMSKVHSVQPSLAVMPDGTVLLTSGRPGIFAWINRDGSGQDWLSVDLQSHHNANHPDDSIRQADHTTSYTEVIPLDNRSVIVIYDRIPHGWAAIPDGARETNSIWVTKISWK